MRPQKGIISQKLLLTAVVVCLFVFCLTSIWMISAKYVSKGSGNDADSVARFSPSLVSDDIILSDIKKPGDCVEKEFTVQNFSGDSVSEVTMKYAIYLNTTGNLPLSYTVLDSEGKTLASWDCNGISGSEEYECENDSFVFAPGAKRSCGYILKAEWTKDKNDAKFSGLTDAVYLSVIWEQVD